MENNPVKMDDFNTINAAFEDARARARAVFHSSKDTLVDQIKDTDWANWNALDENPNVGSRAVSDDDEVDVDYCEPIVA